MQPFLPLALSLVLSAGTGSPRATLDALFAAFNRHDAVALQALYAPTAVLTSSDFCKPRTGADVARTYQAMFREFPDITDEVDTVIITGERAAVRFVSRSRIPGKEFTLKLVTIFRFSAQGIVEDDTTFDTGGRPCEP